MGETKGRPLIGKVGARAMFSPGQRLLLLASFALLIALRLPHAWVNGRFLDEEATVFLAYAWHRPWHDALFRSFGGYWNLGANASTLLVASLVKAGALPLERAPYLTMTLALTVQLLPAVLILTGHAEWLAKRGAVITALLMIAIMPGTEEVFLNVLHVQFHLTLCVAMILAMDVPERTRAKIGYGAILFLTPLCGPGAIVMLPSFGLRALLDRNRGRLFFAVMLAAGTAVQLLIFYGANPMRGHLLDPGTIAAEMFVRLLALPLVGYDSAQGLAILTFLSRVRGGFAWILAVLASLSVFALLIAVALRRRDAAVWLVLAALSLACVTFGFGMIIVDSFSPYDLAAERYQFVPLVLLGLALIALASRPAFPGRAVCVALAGVMLFNGVVGYRHPLATLADGPPWPAEVAAWRSDHDHPLAVWPSPWAADLSDRDRVCTPPGAELAPSADPRYCESGWAAGFFRPRGDYTRERLLKDRVPR